MPTKNPRINVTVSQELYEALSEFRAASGMSSASLLSQLLSETVPVIRAMTEAFKLAKSSPAKASDALREVVQDAHVQVAQLQLDMAPKPKRKKLRKSPTA